MMIAIPDVLRSGSLAKIRDMIAAGAWIDGNVTSGSQSALAKRNTQLAAQSAEAREAGALVLDALAQSALFVAAAVPLKVFPPMFNRHGAGDSFGTHVDSAVRIQPGSDFRIRADLSATLFLSDPADYEGGELVVENRLSDHRVKLPAGHLVLYPSSSLHQIAPVTGGERVACVLWIQSMVRDDARRTILLELDRAVQALAGESGQDHPEIVRLTGVYHNLLRCWAEL